MKRHFGLVVIALAIGCGTEALDTGETEQGLTKHCPDPDNCTVTNGGGVYTEELGDASIGPNDFMITHFINVSGGGVTLEGRGIDTTHPTYYKTQPGTVYYARYNGGPMRQVLSVSETGTLPTFKLATPNGPNFVTGADLLHLQLVLSFGGKLWSITFWNRWQEPGIAGNPNVTLQKFDMRWEEGELATANAQPYCRRAPINNSDPDAVVFEQGIKVNPVTAIMAQDDSYVTLSCRHGAVAMVRWWGYVYNGGPNQTEMFEAAMHMKRASYCGDDSFYTRANTDIMIRDTAGNLHDTLSPTDFEARWGRPANGGPIRALCVNMAHRRHPAALYPPVTGDLFTGTCENGPTIPACADGAFAPLADQLSP